MGAASQGIGRAHQEGEAIGVTGTALGGTLSSRTT
jgi:hypothetical protein